MESRLNTGLAIKCVKKKQKKIAQSIYMLFMPFTQKIVLPKDLSILLDIMLRMLARSP